MEIRLLNYAPKFKNLGPDEILALYGIGTFEGQNLERLMKSFEGKIEKVTKGFHKEATLRGHASLTTSLLLSLEVREVSRNLSMLLAAVPFGSYLQESLRRREITPEYFYIPPFETEREKRIYKKAWETSFQLYKWLRKRKIPKEDARYGLIQGVKTSLFLAVNLETLIPLLSITRKAKAKEKEYLLPEIFEFEKRFSALANQYFPKTYEARMLFAKLDPFLPFSFPFPFRKPDNLSFELERILEGKEVVIVEKNLNRENLEEVKKHYERLRKGNLEDALSFSQLAPLYRITVVWEGDLALYHQQIRQRTVPQGVESIYYAAERFKKDPEKQVKIPPTIEEKEVERKRFLEGMEELARIYEELEIYKPSFAVNVLPQAMKINLYTIFDGNNLFNSRFSFASRLCQRAQWDIRKKYEITLKELEKEFPELIELIGPKCKHLGYCPEKQPCEKFKEYSTKS